MAENETVVIKDEDIVNDYSKLTGYNPETGANDHGAPSLDALNYWRKNGVAGHQIYAFAEINPKDIELVKTAIYLFGGLYVGFTLPNSAKKQDIWRVVNKNLTGDSKPGSWGGHAVNAIGYDKDFIYVVTWGIRKRVTWKFWKAYCWEAFAVISEEFIVSGKAPNGFDLEMLKKQLKGATKVGGDTSESDTGSGKSIWDKYGDKLPPVFNRTIYRAPTDKELDEISRVRFTAPELLQGLNYTIVGRGMSTPANQAIIANAITKLASRYPMRKEYKHALVLHWSTPPTKPPFGQ